MSFNRMSSASVPSHFFLRNSSASPAWRAPIATPRSSPAGRSCRRTSNSLFQEVPELEIAVKGEGEKVFADLLSGAPLPSIAGLLYRTDDGVVENEDQSEVADIDSLPFPAYDLIDLDQYQRQLSYAYNHRRQGVLLTSRGCAYHCTFCFTHWKGIRLRSAANIFEEIKELHDKHGIQDFYIVDDIFNVDAKRALQSVRLDRRRRGSNCGSTSSTVCAPTSPARKFVDRRARSRRRLVHLCRRIGRRRNPTPGEEAPRSGKGQAHHRLYSAPERGRERLDHVRLPHGNPRTGATHPGLVERIAQAVVVALPLLLAVLSGLRDQPAGIGCRLGPRTSGTYQPVLLQRSADRHSHIVEARHASAFSLSTTAALD